MKKALILAIFAIANVGAAKSRADAAPANRLSSVRIPFVAGSASSDIAYSAPTFGGAVAVTRGGTIVYRLSHSSRDLSEGPVGGHARPAAGRAAATTISEFQGPDPKLWRTHLSTFETVSLGNVWPGISVDLRARARSVEKVFTVAAGADPANIRMRVHGARRLRLDRAGALLADTAQGQVSFTAPLAVQTRGGESVPVRTAYVLKGRSGEYGFAVSGYDRTLPIVIDPVFQATYLGGGNDDAASAMAINSTSGDVYVAGQTYSTDLPGTTGGAQATKGFLSYPDAFVARLDAGLTTLEQVTYLGGSGVDTASAIVIQPTSGDVYVAGLTTSTDFPGSVGGGQPQNASNGTTPVLSDAFVSRLNADLTTLDQSTYLGGGNSDAATAIAVHPTSGDVFVTGWTLSSDFPHTSGGAHSGSAGFADLFIARLSGDLKTIDQATYLGGGAYDQASAIAIHPTSGNVYVAGFTLSDDFRSTSGGAQSSHADDNGNADGFVAELDAGLTAVEQATYLGGTGADVINAMAIAASGDIYVAGYSDSTDLPGTSTGAQPSVAGDADAFVARLSSSLTTLENATYIGGSGSDSANAMAIDPASGDVFIAGFTASPDLPGASGGLQPTGAAGGVEDAFAARLSGDLTALRQSTFLGGSAVDQGNAIAIGPAGDIYVAGTTQSLDFPATRGGAQPAHAADGNGTDAFVVGMTATLAPVPPVLQSVSLVPARVVGGAPSEGTVTLTQPALASGALVILSANGPASVPASVTIPAGAVSATFSVATTAVSAPATATISAGFAGVSQSATLTVEAPPVRNLHPAATPPPIVPIENPGR